VEKDFRMNITARASGALSLLFLAACGRGGGGSGSSNDPPPATNQAVGGIWTTQYTVTSGTNTGDVIDALALISENGQYFEYGKNTTNGCAAIGFGNVSASGTTLSGSGDYVVVQYTTIPGVTVDCVDPDGSDSGTSSITGSITQRVSADITETDTTSMGTVIPESTQTYTFSSLYLNPSSLSTIAGNYADGSATLSISGSGVISEQDSNGCVLSGQVSIINATYNAYAVQVSWANCTGSDTVLNGVSVSGLVTFDTSQSPAALVGGVSGNVSGKAFAEIFDLPQT
jgi:hypothetical protein